MWALVRNHFSHRQINRSNLKEVLSLAIPAMVENVLQVFLGMIDMIFIARLGTEAVAGVGLTNLLMNIFIAIFTALGVGTTAIVSRNIGAQKQREAELAVEQSVYSTLIIGLLLGLVTLVFAKNFMNIFAAEERVIASALPYFQSVAVPSVFLALMLVLSSALRGAGDTKTPLKVTLVINVLNVILDYLLIFGFFSFPGFGILGAGLATSISRFIGVLILLCLLILRKGPLDTVFKHGLIFKRKMMKTIWIIGLPAALERLVMRCGQVVYSAMIIQLGTEAYAAHNIAGSIESLSYMPGYGFAIAASTLVGQNLGANKPERAQNMGLVSTVLGIGFMVLIGSIFFFFARPLGLFYTEDELVLKQVVMVLKIIALVQPALCLTLVVTAALQGAGDTKFPMYSTIIGIWGIRVAGVYLLGIVCKLGLFGVWLAVASDLVLRGILLLYRFYNGKWKEIEF